MSPRPALPDSARCAAHNAAMTDDAISTLSAAPAFNTAEPAHPRVVNVSSGAGSFEDPKYGLLHGTIVTQPMGYGISKLALNGLTVKMAKEFAGDRILVNSVCPDITDTFGTGMFGRPVQESAKSVIWAAMLPNDGPSGGFFRDGEPLPW